MVSLHAAVLALTLSSAGQTVLLEFYSDGCPPCRAMASTVQSLVDKGYPVRQLNIAQHQDVAAKLGVNRTPTFVMLVDGRPVDRVIGGTTFSRLERMCLLGKPQSAASAPSLLAQISGPGPGPLPAAPPAAIPNMPTNPAWRGQAPSAAWQTAAAAPQPSAPPAAVVTPVAAQPGGRMVSDAHLIAATVRLRVEDPNGHSCGSGTIIDARDNQALILTCGHVFRDSKGQGKVEVDLFGPRGPQRVLGQIVKYDPQRSEQYDLALVAINTPGPVEVARVAPAGYRVTPGQPVISVGCNNGDEPTARHSQVSSLDKYVGPPNIQVADQPVEGRSGGGLFSADGLLIGVCNAADPADREGLYAALGSIHTELERNGLSFVCQAAPGVVPNAMPAAMNTATLAAHTAPAAPAAAPAATRIPDMPETMPSSALPGPFGTPPVARAPATAPAISGNIAGPGMPPYEQAALSDMKNRVRQGATVVCIVNNPNGQSEVFMLENTSPEFRKQIAAGSRPQPAPHLTSLNLPRREILLEWSADKGPETNNAAEMNKSWQADAGQ